jgi:demethylmenaquinone methyltransferase/2-methoxy-6-polyprenyl-1,4-benzoquinol methylase
VLELACGSGWWTKRLALTARTVTAVDASPEMLAINRERVPGTQVRRLVADMFSWIPDRQYDMAFFSFWLSHVPNDRFEAFWDLVARSLKPTGRVFFVDESQPDRNDGSEQLLEDERGAAIRELDDGRRFRMVKVYHEPLELEERLRALGWAVSIHGAGPRIYFGLGSFPGGRELAR